MQPYLPGLVLQKSLTDMPLLQARHCEVLALQHILGPSGFGMRHRSVEICTISSSRSRRVVSRSMAFVFRFVFLFFGQPYMPRFFLQ